MTIKLTHFGMRFRGVPPGEYSIMLDYSRTSLAADMHQTGEYSGANGALRSSFRFSGCSEE